MTILHFYYHKISKKLVSCLNSSSLRAKKNPLPYSLPSINLYMSCMCISGLYCTLSAVLQNEKKLVNFLFFARFHFHFRMKYEFEAQYWSRKFSNMKKIQETRANKMTTLCRVLGHFCVYTTRKLRIVMCNQRIFSFVVITIK